jgi:ribosomal-protein-alanine N-acetyltransferase
MHHVTRQGAPSPATAIETSRLLLVTVTASSLQAHDANELAASTGLTIPSSWPPEHWDADALHWLLNKMAEFPDTTGWCRYIALKPAGLPTLIGTCGCVGPPEATDDVEIGYSVLPEYQRQGYATEAVTALIEWIFGFARVRSVNAQTFPHLAASLGVLRRCGFAPAGEGSEPGAVRFRRMRL